MSSSDTPVGVAQASSGSGDDQEAVARLVETFFAAFRSGPDGPALLSELRGMFLPHAVVVRTCGTEPAVYGVEEFIAPRQALLAEGSLVDFTEWAVGGRTEIFGGIAHHFGSYAKEGVQDGVRFAGRGMKSMQLIRTSQGWRISAVAWDDERDGLKVPDELSG